MSKWKIKTEGGLFRVLAPQCRHGHIIPHLIAKFIDLDHPIECWQTYGSPLGAYRAVERALISERMHSPKYGTLAPQALMEPPC